jgi:hypothetical protein
MAKINEITDVNNLAGKDILLNDSGTPVKTSANHLNFTGTIITTGSDTAPAGYLLCDGSTISRTTYATLFAEIGDTHGVGDGSTTFAIPDLRGVVVRGTDGGRGLDTGRVFGSFQGDAIRNITGTMSARTGANISAGAFYKTSAGSYAGNHVGNHGSTEFFDASRVVPTAAENRVKSVALNYYIKY